MKFFVDHSLGRLTKWLRLLGFDVVPMKLTANEFHSLPRPERNNFILTRQASLPAKLNRPDLIVLKAEDTEAQLLEICQRLNISPKNWEPLIRCSTCNQILQPITHDQAEGRVPDFTSQKYDQFFECPQCEKVFWEGSHQAQIRRHLQKLKDHLLAH